MYNTIKELHIEIEQRIQQITSNRHRSIAPQFIDMVLNRTAIRYIQTRTNRKVNYKQEGFEDSQKRVDDIQSLKTESSWLKIIKNDESDNSGYVILPADYLKLITSRSKVIYSKPFYNKDLNTFVNTNKTIYFLNVKDIISKDNVVISINHLDSIYECDISDILSTLELSEFENPDLYEVSSLIIDKVKASTNGKVIPYWEEYCDAIAKNCLIFDTTITCDVVEVNTKVYNYAIHEITDGMTISVAENDLVSTEEVYGILNNFYSSRNRHLNPVTDIVNGKLNVYYDKNFIVNSIKLSYIRKPRSFNLALNQMSDLEITPEFMDMVVSDILLILKDNSFNYIKQQSNFE